MTEHKYSSGDIFESKDEESLYYTIIEPIGGTFYDPHYRAISSYNKERVITEDILDIFYREIDDSYEVVKVL